MSEFAEAKPKLLSFPLELLDNVWQRLDKKSLKSLRLTSRICNRLSTPMLFRSFSVYPHTRSFERLILVSEASNVANHVQCIIYDTVFVGLTNMILQRLRSVYSADISEEDKKAAIDHTLVLHKQNILVDVPTDLLASLSYLERAFAGLPNLKSVFIRDAAGGPFTQQLLWSNYSGSESLPHFYTQIVDETCGKFEHTRLERGYWGSPHCRAPYSLPVLMALHKMPGSLEEIDMVGVRWISFLQIGDWSKHHSLFKGLESLKAFRIVAPTDCVFPGGRAMHDLQSLLKIMPVLEKLALCFRMDDDIYVRGQRMLGDEYDVECRSYFEARGRDPNELQVPAQLSWAPKLKHLELQGLMCTSKEMRGILKHCATTLRTLVLGRLVLVPEERSGPRACLVSLFKWIQKHMPLENIRLENYLINCGMQNWWVVGNVPELVENTLYGKVKEFILKGGPCPLDYVAVPAGHYDVHKKSYVEMVPDSLLEESFSGDESWEMRYNDDELSELDEDEDSDLDVPLDVPFGYGMGLPFDWTDDDFIGDI